MPPIKRIAVLKPLSRDHHHGLLLCWKIRTGLNKDIQPQRIKVYAEWFWRNHLKPHFDIEENYVFSILGNENKLIKQALTEHHRIKYLFEFSDEIIKNLNLIEEELDAHIRFEERLLFNEIQEIATMEQLQQIERHHSDTKFIDNLSDPFWE